MEYEDLDPDRKVITVPPGAAGRERFLLVLVSTDDNFSQASFFLT